MAAIIGRRAVAAPLCVCAGEDRITTELATRRNEFVVALADEVCFAHITPGGQADASRTS